MRGIAAYLLLGLSVMICLGQAAIQNIDAASFASQILDSDEDCLLFISNSWLPFCKRVEKTYQVLDAELTSQNENKLRLFRTHSELQHPWFQYNWLAPKLLLFKKGNKNLPEEFDIQRTGHAIADFHAFLADNLDYVMPKIIVKSDGLTALQGGSWTPGDVSIRPGSIKHSVSFGAAEDALAAASGTSTSTKTCTGSGCGGVSKPLYDPTKGTSLGSIAQQLAAAMVTSHTTSTYLKPAVPIDTAVWFPAPAPNLDPTPNTWHPTPAHSGTQDPYAWFGYPGNYDETHSVHPTPAHHVESLYRPADHTTYDGAAPGDVTVLDKKERVVEPLSKSRGVSRATL